MFLEPIVGTTLNILASTAPVNKHLPVQNSKLVQS